MPYERPLYQSSASEDSGNSMQYESDSETLFFLRSGSESSLSNPEEEYQKCGRWGEHRRVCDTDRNISPLSTKKHLPNATSIPCHVCDQEIGGSVT